VATRNAIMETAAACCQHFHDVAKHI